MTPIRGPSLTLRLTLLFALASAFVLFLLGLLIGNAVERHFEEQDLDVLTGKMQLARHILERKPDSQPKETLTQQLDDALTGHHGLIVAVYDPEWRNAVCQRSDGVSAGSTKHWRDTKARATRQMEQQRRPAMAGSFLDGQRHRWWR